MLGLITDIDRFSTHDGPGIRTTVFFQGCPMHCAWCHSPETQPASPVPIYRSMKCIGCRNCMYVCPHGAITPKKYEEDGEKLLCLCGGLSLRRTYEKFQGDEPEGGKRYYHTGYSLLPPFRWWCYAFRRRGFDAGGICS